VNFEGTPYFTRVTILEVIRRSHEFLAKRDVESPRLQVELLLAHALQLPRLKLYLNFERVLTEAELATVRELVKKRGERQPLQHLVGSVSFCGLELAVNPHVLIPRPETELLAERAWQFLGARPHPPATALDFGTGSGCLAIALAVKCPTAQIHAVDISSDALAVARQNAARHGATERIQFHAGDGFAPLPAGLRCDLIVANPPYIPSAEILTLEPEVRDHDPRPALDGGTDGLDFYRRLAREATVWLKPDGKLMLEFGEGQAAVIGVIFQQHEWNIERVEKDLSGRLRFLIASRGQL
jgi:release factor glutamine methyltransferase